jgi:glycosyltransferase involved in cell wall biosynthesis
MKIAFDAKRITMNKTGLGNYGRFVVNALASQYTEDDFLLYTTNEVSKELEQTIPRQNNVKYLYPSKKGGSLHKSLWRTFGIVDDLVKDKVDLFHGLSNEIPLNLRKYKIPSVVTIHDLIFLRYPQFYKQIDRLIYHYKFKKACELSDRIIAVSETTKTDIISAFHIAENKIDVVFQGCNPAFSLDYSNADKQIVKEKLKLPDKYILSVGTIEERKNLFLTVKALKESKLDIPLVVVGKPTAYADRVKSYIQEQGMSMQIHFLEHVYNSDLPLIYQQASLFVYPSLFEGFGIPILEALHSGVPVIAATGSCLEEAGGPGSVYIDPINEKELAEAFKFILTSPEQVEKMKKEGLQYAARFKAPELAFQIRNIYTKIT